MASERDFKTIDIAANVAARNARRDEAVAFIAKQLGRHPTSDATAIILGSGLGGLADKIVSPVAISYHDIPGFARSTASGHKGQMIFGTLEGSDVIAMAGRFHRYEGWTVDEVAFPVHVMHALGARRLIVSNAAGGVNPKFRVGDIVVIRNHINLMTGISTCSEYAADLPVARRGEIYDSNLSASAIQTAVTNNFTAHEGTYLATFGPTYETRAEYRMQRKIGADVAGMSTVPEVLAAADLGMPVLGLSLVTNVASPDLAIKADHGEVLEAGQAGAAKMEQIVRRILRAL